MVEHVARLGDRRLDAWQWCDGHAARPLALVLQPTRAELAALCPAGSASNREDIERLLRGIGIPMLNAARRGGALAQRVATRAVWPGLGNVRPTLAKDALDARMALDWLEEHKVDLDAAQERAGDLGADTRREVASDRLRDAAARIDHAVLLGVDGVGDAA